MGEVTHEYEIICTGDNKGDSRTYTGGGVAVFAGGIILILAGLNYRFDWIRLPNAVVIGAAVVFIVGYSEYKKRVRNKVIPLIW